jgi:rubrerythrin
MKMHTCSQIIGFTRELENTSAKFYEALSQKYAKEEDVFLSFVKENKKYLAEVERTYYEVITDAIEGCFAFNINPDEYTLKTELAEETSYSQALDKAVEIEEKIMGFYSHAAEQSKSLMADVPRALAMIARKRESRVSKLRLLLEED